MMTQDYIRHRKRPLNLSYALDTDQQRTTNIRRKPEYLTCSICGGSAHGYNFDAITCESCKAFFRRNALKPDSEFKCRINTGKCVITESTRKRCKACRLAKCLEQGMRADWILTDAERVKKRKKIEENRLLRQTIYPDSSDTDEMETIKRKDRTYDNEQGHDTNGDSSVSLSLMPVERALLSPEDLIKIKKVQQAYSDSVRLISLPSHIPSYPQLVRITEASDMINIPANIQATRLITYFKLLPEFSSLNENDKLILIKYNTFPLAFIRAALTYDVAADTYHEPNTDDCIFAGTDLIKCFGLHQYEQSTRCIQNLLIASANDTLILQILLVVMIFSKGSSICTYEDEVEPIAENILAIFTAQNLFVDLLWKYCQNKFGYSKTAKIWLKLTMSSMDAHFQASTTRHDYIKVDSVARQLLPLMKSVMLIV
ncbi:unnamed protein product [Rotaria socialis]|uniref:Uncharacterized protein n=2 Tax=Rotaria socialis TaxID=392032 RepID=A0A819UVZ3_9BILA|nr:unnamed protein product [Rotaria socialis]CAF3438506.1 unnamed protein product [Rotaria socialis]CAF4100156.1 unnamed protein product [Rotaria socialis]CAF4463092.1 unnamed protein product [Rotaria socialis]CAF4608139.1 unnamed protein product [Rotaria socialis]